MIDELLALLLDAPIRYRGDARLIEFKQDDTIEEALHQGLVRLDAGFLEITEAGRAQVSGEPAG